ncbi:MAG: outer membrane beta-barrel protein [Syntrophales bacterium]|nr:outer membrane beta-barrel protein [Syntrophales bacterium]
MTACHQQKFAAFFVVIAVMVGVLVSPPAMGKGRIEIVPMITVGETYDDNIFLDKDDRKSDYITTVSPGIGFDLYSSNNGLNLYYSPTFVKYHEYTNNDTTRHNARLNLWQKFGESWRVDLEEYYLKSEEATEESFADYEKRRRSRHTLYTYERNVADAALSYQFGPEDLLTAGYRHELLENEDPSLDDTIEHGPYAGLIYWFDVHNGTDLKYRFTRTEFERNDGAPEGDNFDGHEVDIRYLYRFNPRTTGYIGYGYTRRDFEKASRKDRQVHEGSVGITHGLSSRTSLSLDTGYYKPNGYGTENDTGHVSYGATLESKFERGAVSLMGRGGWDEDYLDAEQRDYTRYWTIAGNVDYTVMQNINAYAGASYRKNRYLSDTEDETYRGRCGFRMRFLRWYSLGLEYSYLNRMSDDPGDEYVDNRVMLTLSASRPFQLAD